jgi:hypothetical protein
VKKLNWKKIEKNLVLSGKFIEFSEKIILTFGEKL